MCEANGPTDPVGPKSWRTSLAPAVPSAGVAREHWVGVGPRGFAHSMRTRKARSALDGGRSSSAPEEHSLAVGKHLPGRFLSMVRFEEVG